MSPGNTRNVKKWKVDRRGVSNRLRHSTSSHHRRRKMLRRRLCSFKRLATMCKGKAVSGNISYPLCNGDAGARQPGEMPMRMREGRGGWCGCCCGKDATCASLHPQVQRRVSIRKVPGAALLSSHPQP